MSNRPDISCVVTAKLCHSCGACYAVCSTNSITYSETVGGNIFPEINFSNCSHCGLCYTICPSIHFGKSLAAQMPDDPFTGTILNAYVGKATNETIFLNSQSGGAVTALVEYLFSTGQISGAIVAIMRPGTPPCGDVIVAKSVEDLLTAQKSKYVPIPLLKAIKEIKDVEGRIAVVGLSCHMHGLNNLLDMFPKLNEKIAIKIGLICDRVMTTASIDFLAARADCDIITNITFRDKRRPTYPGNVVVESATGKSIVLPAYERMQIKNFFTPARCRLCFDKMNIFADIVVGDPHGLQDIDRQSGESLVLIRTSQGKELLDSISSVKGMILREVSVQDALHGQGIDTKKKIWKSFIAIWKNDKRVLPSYLDRISKTEGYPDSKTILLMKQAIELDTFKDRQALIAHYKRKVILSKYKNAVKGLIRGVLEIVGR